MFAPVAHAIEKEAKKVTTHAVLGHTGHRRRAILLGAALSTAPSVGWAQQAQWPTRPIRLVIPFAPGGSFDVLGRVIAERLRTLLPQPIVVENRAGAGGNIAAEAVARAAPDGYTLLLGASSLVQNAAVFGHLPYHPIRDFSPVSEVAYYSLILVAGPKLTVRSVEELVAAAKARPGELTYSSAGVGTPTHLAGELFAQRAGIDITHVPFAGAAPGQAALLGGQVDFVFQNPVQALPAIRGGQLRALAVTAAERSVALPDVPTVAESGYPGFEAGTWGAVFGPASMPPEVVAALREKIQEVLRMPELVSVFAVQGLEVRDAGPERLAEIMREDLQKWTEVVRRAGIRAE